MTFYLDGVSFIHKGNPLNEVVSPRSRVWQKRSEGLSLTSNCSKDLARGKRVHLMVAIAPRKESINLAISISNLIKWKFLTIFRRVGKTCSKKYLSWTIVHQKLQLWLWVHSKNSVLSLREFHLDHQI